MISTRLLHRGITPHSRAHRPDYAIVISIYALLFWGVIMIYSIGPVLSRAVGISVSRQLLAVGISTLAFFFAVKLPVAYWRKLLPLIVATALVSTALLLLPGDLITDSSGGAVRWLEFGSFSFQPVELVKLAMVMYLAVFLASRIRHGKINDRRATLIPVGGILIVTAIFVAGFQKDLGTMMVIAAIAYVMLFAAGLSKKDLVALLLSGLLAVAALILIAPHRIDRVATFIAPGGDPTGSGYHIQQSLIAIGSGGIGGLGLGHSVQAFGYLPEVANDSVFAIHAESVGFIGITILLMVFVYLLRRVHLQALAATTDYHRLLIMGIFTWVLCHVLVNVGAMIGLVPLTGITLPLISYGGSSMVLMMLALGIVFQLSKYSNLGVINAETALGRKR